MAFKQGAALKKFITSKFEGFRSSKLFSRKSQSVIDGSRKQGSVKWFNPTKGFGFIAQDQGEDLFVHQTEIDHTGFRSLNKGDRVEFEVGNGDKGPIAKNVKKIGESTEPAEPAKSKDKKRRNNPHRARRNKRSVAQAS